MHLFPRRCPASVFQAAGVLLFLIGLVCAVLWILAPSWVEDPMPALRKHTPVRIWLDRTGKEVRTERTFDAEWRFDTPMEDIPENVVRIILATEDANFFRHSGVDYAAVLRAAWQNLTGFRIVSGASTIPMQLATMAYPETKRRTFRGKLLQAIRARRLVRDYPRELLLREYLNRIPFGGKIYGIEAASRYYFACPPSGLTLPETALLCGLPQRPNAHRPDRHPDRAKKRQKRVLSMLERQGIIAPGEAEKMFRAPLKFRDFRAPADFQALTRPDESVFFFRKAAKESKYSFRIPSSFDREKSTLLLESLRRFTSASESGPRDAAGVILDNRTGEFLAYIGTTDLDSPYAGQVDAASAVRTAGSVLKPFLYREAVSAGLIGPDTILLDAPLRFAGYMPGNADGMFRGSVSASDALNLSLNTPAVRLVAELSPLRMAKAFASAGLLIRPGTAARKSGLSLALGTAGHSLEKIAAAYTLFTGKQKKGTFLKTEEPPSEAEETVPDPASAMIAWILSTGAPLPGATIPAGWKTGTSSDARDAWCAAFTPEYTVAVWFGNKDGSPVPGLTGLNTAAPCAGTILQALYRQSENCSALPCPPDPRFFEYMKRCGKTGLTASSACSKSVTGVRAKGIPVRTCTLCERDRKPAGRTCRIIRPKPGNYKVEDRGLVMLRLEADTDVIWFADGRFLGKVPPNDRISFSPGQHTVTAVPEASGLPATVHFSVE